MKRLTSAGLFVSPKTARKANVRVEHAKLVVASAREHAAKTAHGCRRECGCNRIEPISSGSNCPVVGKELPLAEAARTHKEILEPGASGKIVLVC